MLIFIANLLCLHSPLLIFITYFLLLISFVWNVSYRDLFLLCIQLQILNYFVKFSTIYSFKSLDFSRKHLKSASELRICTSVWPIQYLKISVFKYHSFNALFQCSFTELILHAVILGLYVCNIGLKKCIWCHSNRKFYHIKKAEKKIVFVLLLI